MIFHFFVSRKVIFHPKTIKVASVWHQIPVILDSLINIDKLYKTRAENVIWHQMILSSSVSWQYAWALEETFFAAHEYGFKHHLIIFQPDFYVLVLKLLYINNLVRNPVSSRKSNFTYTVSQFPFCLVKKWVSIHPHVIK